jgi:Zn-finger nucleic acid-binding protein
MNDLFKPHQCPRCFGLFDVRKKVWNDRGTIYHLTCWFNKTKEDDELRGKTSAYDDELHGKSSAYDDELHGKASAYANNRKDSYCEKMRKKEVEQQTNTQLDWIWVAHYEGYKEGYWTATSNNFFTTDPAKLKDKNT